MPEAWPMPESWPHSYICFFCPHRQNSIPTIPSIPSLLAAVIMPQHCQYPKCTKAAGTCTKHYWTCSNGHTQTMVLKGKACPNPKCTRTCKPDSSVREVRRIGSVSTPGTSITHYWDAGDFPTYFHQPYFYQSYFHQPYFHQPCFHQPYFHQPCFHQPYFHQPYFHQPTPTYSHPIPTASIMPQRCQYPKCTKTAGTCTKHYWSCSGSGSKGNSHSKATVLKGKACGRCARRK